MVAAALPFLDGAAPMVPLSATVAQLGVSCNALSDSMFDGLGFALQRVTPMAAAQQGLADGEAI